MKKSFEKYFYKSVATDYIVKPAAENAIDTFNDICTRYIPHAVTQTESIATEILKITRSHHQTITNHAIAEVLFRFVKQNIQYKLDKAGLEQIRMPSKLWEDGFGDCEDYTIFCSSILINLNIPHMIRMADYGQGWQHIYIKVGKVTLDPVQDGFNYEDSGRYYDYKIDAKVSTKAKLWETNKTKGFGRIGIDPTQARKEGKFIEGGQIFERQKNLKSKLIRGRDCKISFSLDIEVEGYYALIPADLLQPSHNGNVENPLHFIPDAQPRNRAISPSGANTPRLIAEKLRPAEICEGSTAYSGTPIINERGEVIQGNGRAATMKIYWEEFSDTYPVKYIEYLETAEKHFFSPLPGERSNNLFFDTIVSSKIPRFNGRTHATVSRKKTLNYPELEVSKPVLVRVVPCTDEEAIILGQYKQSDLEAVSTRTNDTKSKVSLVTPKLFDDIIRVVFAENESTSEELSLSELIRKSGVSNLLIRNKIFRADDFTENYVNQRTGELNADGVRVITDLIVGLIFKGSDTNTPELFRQLPERTQTAIAKSAKYILGTDSKNSLAPEVSKAIRGTISYLQYKEMGNSFNAWASQTAIFGKSPKEEYSKVELTLIQLFGDAKIQKVIVDIFRQYYTITNDEVRTGIDFTNEPIRKATNRSAALEKVFNVGPKSILNTSSNAEEKFVQRLQSDFQNQVKHNKNSLERIAKEIGVEKSIEIKELTELAIVNVARSLANDLSVSEKQRYENIVELYKIQPNSSLRTSESMLFQQYSTPVPIAYLMGKYCGIDENTHEVGQFYEPSAGNGVLTIACPNTFCFDVNELSDFRYKNLKKQGFASVTKKDASRKDLGIERKYQAILTNPPFGKLDDKTNFDGYPVGNLDHLMTITALQTMKNDGRAAIIIGGNTTWDSEGRIQAGKNRIFLSYLYANYEIDDIINVDGKYLYSRQGTGFNVRIILVNGRKAKPEGYAPLYNKQTDVQVKDFDTLYQRFLPFIKAQSVKKINQEQQKKFNLKYKYRLRLQIQEYENANTQKN
jgi:hypothetical protein